MNKKLLFFISICFIFFIANLPSSASANDENSKNQFFTSTASETLLKAEALTTANQVGKLLNGEAARALDETTNPSGERWVQLQQGETVGWALLSNLELMDWEKNYLNKQLFVAKDTRVRKSATYSADIAYPIKKGTTLDILSSITMGNETWYRISDGKKSGWLPSAETTNQTALSTYLYAGSQNVQLRRGASTSYIVAATLSNGQRVKATAQFINANNEVWVKAVLDNGKSGWVLASSLTNKKLKIAYLTIDDGPSIYSNKLLDILKKYDAKATFFMISGHMSTYSGAVKRMVKEGHAVGSHSVTHDKNKFYRSPSSAVSEMTTTRNTLEKITGVHSNLMRVPYGSVPYMKQSYRVAMNKQQFIMWDWTVDSLDWKFNSASYVSYTMNQVKKQERSGTTPVILIHDRKATVDNLPALLSGLEKLGYTLVPLTESVTPYQFSAR